jgi:hypothetical protein
MQKNRRTASGALRALLTLSATTSLFAAPHAHADFVYGLNSTASKGIYQIDTATGATTLVASTPSLTASSASSNSLTLHWEECPGIEKMKSSNRESESGTISSIASRYGMPARCCRFCYEIESNRRTASGAASGTPGVPRSEPTAP